MPKSPPSNLISDLMLPELERQLSEDDSLWPNVKGLFIITVTKKRKPAATWYCITITAILNKLYSLFISLSFCLQVLVIARYSRKITRINSV